MRLRRHDRAVRDLVKAGIIDPAKVTRSALENAASVAAMILTTEALVTERPEKAPAGAGRRRHARLRLILDRSAPSRGWPRGISPGPTSLVAAGRLTSPRTAREVGEPFPQVTGRVWRRPASSTSTVAWLFRSSAVYLLCPLLVPLPFDGQKPVRPMLLWCPEAMRGGRGRVAVRLRRAALGRSFLRGGLPPPESLFQRACWLPLLACLA